jgi:outer membrane receptor protein involved in Fe transport
MRCIIEIAISRCRGRPPFSPTAASRALFAALAIGTGTVAFSAGVQTLDTVEVIDSSENLIGTADSANQGTVARQQIESRPNYRPGELLEAAPGLIATQHSGEGKANQYFLRGINLDHGTDLATTVDGMPVNQRTHAHGQGYTDLNFLITDVVGGLQYKKGPYYADEGDFANAGAVSVLFPRQLDAGIAKLEGGQFGYRRALLADSPKVGNGNLLYALEAYHNDGPWSKPDDYRKFNGMLRYAEGTQQNGFNLTAMAYQGNWNATNQIPQRALDLGVINRFDTLDSTDGGEASRYSLSGSWGRTGDGTATSASAYVIRSNLKLWSNFTFLDDFNNSAQIEQKDSRTTSGINAKQTWFGKWGGHDVDNTIGIQTRNDNIGVALLNSAQRVPVTTVRDDHVVETSGGVYYQNGFRWNDWLRSVAGLRADYYRARVSSDNAQNSGVVNDHMISPKLSLIFGPWAKTEYYLNWGRGFRSNDARGATISVDPSNPINPATREPLLVRTDGYEAGLRTAIIPHLQSSFNVFVLNAQSELLFQGDAGTTRDTGRPSRRAGFEFSNLYTPTSWLMLDADVAYARARYTDGDPNGIGTRVPEAIEGVATFTAAIDNRGPYYGSLRLRYFGPRALIEDNTVRSSSTTLFSGRIGYKFDKKFRVQLDGFNLLNRQAQQIAYYYPSRFLTTDPAGGINSVHAHPTEPRSFRVAAIMNF